MLKTGPVSDAPEIGERAWVVKGRVQGVGFRRFVELTALEHQLRGWVRNLPDGSVQVVVSGEVGRIDALFESVREGPRFGRVDSVEKIDVPHDIRSSKTFEIR